jgi:hypothetical protein
MPKGYPKYDGRTAQRGARSPAQKANIARIKSQGRTVAQKAKGPTSSWWTCPPEQWADKARDAAIRMGAVSSLTNYRTPNQD